MHIYTIVARIEQTLHSVISVMDEININEQTTLIATVPLYVPIATVPLYVPIATVPLS